MAAAALVTAATTSICRVLIVFRDAESYYATLAHESTHWTRHRRALTAI